MKPVFKEDKATQVAAKLLKLGGDSMSHLKLMKLIYLVEREALIQLNRPVTFDWCFSMDHGPILSQTLNLMHGDTETDGLWKQTISEPSNHEVKLISDPGNDKLSDAEENIINNIFDKHGHKSRWELRDFTHTLKEWKNPKGSSIEIEYSEILRAGGKTDSEIEAILDDIQNLAIMESHLNR